MLIYYSVLSAIGIICFIFSSIILDHLKVDIDGSDCAAIGMFFFSLIPTAGIYLANNAPLSKSKSMRIAINVTSFVAMAFCVVLCGWYAEEWTKDLSATLVSSLIFSYVATTANQFYMAKESSYLEDDGDASGLVAKALSIAKRVLGKIGQFKDEHHDAYLIISTIICTLLSGLAVALIMLVISIVIGIIVIGIIGLIVIGMLSNSSSKESRSTIYEVWEDGYKRTLTYKDYAFGKGDRYVDDRGDYWITEDNGKTFYREYR